MRRLTAFAFSVLCAPAMAGSYDEFARAIDANNRGEAGTAIESFSRAIAAGSLAKPYLPAAFLGRARALLREGRCTAAAADLDEALILKPGYADALLFRSEVAHCVALPPQESRETVAKPAATYQTSSAGSREPDEDTPAAERSCVPEQKLEMQPDWFGGMTVTASVGDARLSLLVDTGGSTSMLTRSTVTALGVPTRPLKRERVTLYGGLQLTDFVRIDNAAVGRGQGPLDYYVMPDDRVPYAVSGTLAPDFLSRFDVEFDFAHARMSLYAPGACLWGPWSGSAAVPVTRDGNNHLIVPVNLDGRVIPAMLDTGASRSDLSLETAQDLFGADLRDMHAATSRDAEPGLYSRGFHMLTLGGTHILDPAIVIVPDGIARRPAASPRLILGMNVLRRLHLYISYSRNTLGPTPAR